MNYKSLLAEIYNAPAKSSTELIFPSEKILFPIDLASRTISAPEVLSIESEHYAETVYFLVDRYYDNMDLAQTNCVIQYTTDYGNFVYAVPFCDITTFLNDHKMVIPWSISSAATKNEGTISFVLRFYLIDESSILVQNDEPDVSNAQFSYSLVTLPATSKVLKTLPAEDFMQEAELLQEPSLYQMMLQNINEAIANLAVYWIDASNLPNEEGD